ncbi:MAG TPA: tetratricopeptide repeat protein, partial [Pyrinomonadaceae bacterium]|nr:tetratricopeptide repeat protein [Pyrinomonadaceae bacterium]
MIFHAILCLFALTVFAQTPQNVTERAQLRAFIETGRYTEAEAAAKKVLQKTPDNGAVRHELAETLALTGRYTEAITEFERAAADSAKANNVADQLESDLRRAEVLALTGQEDRAKTIYESFVKHYT